MKEMAMMTRNDFDAARARDPNIATSHWEARAFLAESVFDPSYERATAALRRWVDGMEAALGTPRPRTGEVV
jgi:hypothetical protein